MRNLESYTQSQERRLCCLACERRNSPFIVYFQLGHKAYSLPASMDDKELYISVATHLASPHFLEGCYYADPELIESILKYEPLFRPKSRSIPNQSNPVNQMSIHLSPYSWVDRGSGNFYVVPITASHMDYIVIRYLRNVTFMDEDPTLGLFGFIPLKKMNLPYRVIHIYPNALKK